MSMREVFWTHVGKSYVGLVSTDGCTNEFKVGSKTIELKNHEIAIIDYLIKAAKLKGNSVSASDLAQQVGFISEDYFKIVWNCLQEKLSEFDIVNYGGNGSYYDDTIYADELLKEDDGFYSFNLPLAELIGKKPILSDQQLDSIGYQSSGLVPFLKL